MYEALVARVRYHIQKAEFMGLKEAESTLLLKEAADAIEELTAERDKYKRHSDSILKLPDCNTCGKKAKGNCEFMPAYGDWVRINCAFWTPQPPKEG